MTDVEDVDEDALTPPTEPSSTRFRSATDYDTESSLRAALTDYSADYREHDPEGGGGLPATMVQQVEHCIFDTNLDNFCCDWQVKLDLSTSTPQSVEDEARRLMELKEYAILGSDHEEKFERITALASRIFQVPICLISLVDIGRQWFMSNRGLGDVRETSRGSSFCAHAILSKQEVFVVTDTQDDPRFRTNPLVIGSPYIRFYAGAPLVTPGGFKIGTLCVIDPRPRPEGLKLEEKQNLRELAEMVVDTFVYRKQERERLVDEKTRLIACAAHDLLSPLTGIRLNLELLMDDETLGRKLDDTQKELMDAAVKCSDMIERICVQAIETFRGDLKRDHEPNPSSEEGSSNNGGENCDGGGQEKGLVNVNQLVDTVERVVGTFPKKVPFFVQKDDNVPKAIISDDLKLFRSVLNYISNACKHTQTGSIVLRIYVRMAAESSMDMELGMLPGALFSPKHDSFIMEVHDTGPGIELEKYLTLFTPHAIKPVQMEYQHSKMTNSGLGLYSVASEIGSLGGEFGVFSRQDLMTINDDDDLEFFDVANTNFEAEVSGSVFWFSIPLVLPAQAEVSGQAFMSAPDLVSKSKDISDDTADRMARKRSSGELSDVIVRLARTRSSGELLRSGPKKNSGNANATFDPLPQQMPSTNALMDRLTSAMSFDDSNKTDASTPLELKNDTTERGKAVLIIDDSISIRKGLVRGFSRLGFDVDEAENGMQGLKLLKNRLYDLVLLDFLMPVMDGPDMARMFREWENNNRPNFHQYIVGISAHANGKDAEVGIKAGMDQFIGKPISLKALNDLAQSKAVIQATMLLDLKHKKSLEDLNTALHMAENKSKSQLENKSLSESSASSKTASTVEKQCCLIVAKESEPALYLCKRVAEKNGWRVVVDTHGDGESALRLLKLRNWDAAFIDNDLTKLSGTNCLLKFRDWESRVRTVKQRNIYIMSNTQSAVTGFDGVLMKPLNPLELVNVFESASIKISNVTIDTSKRKSSLLSFI